MPDFARDRYVSLATFRRDGREVATPVWIAADPADPKRGWIYTNGNAGKVKRLRHTPRVRVARCGVRGDVKGPWADGSARIAARGPEEERGLAALTDKYGWQMRLLVLGARLGGRWRERALLDVRLA